LICLRNCSSCRTKQSYDTNLAKSEEKKIQQDATIICLLLTSVSKCFGHHYAHLQENKDRVNAFGVLLLFCWMWLVAFVGAVLQDASSELSKGPKASKLSPLLVSSLNLTPRFCSNIRVVECCFCCGDA
jgi:hypothetical protein